MQNACMRYNIYYRIINFMNYTIWQSHNRFWLSTLIFQISSSLGLQIKIRCDKFKANTIYYLFIKHNFPIIPILEEEYRTLIHLKKYVELVSLLIKKSLPTCIQKASRNETTFLDFYTRERKKELKKLSFSHIDVTSCICLTRFTT